MTLIWILAGIVVLAIAGVSDFTGSESKGTLYVIFGTLIISLLIKAMTGVDLGLFILIIVIFAMMMK